MLLQACLNGGRARSAHAAIPVSVRELVHDAIACADAGAEAFHIHVRDDDGRETLDPTAVDATALAVRDACGLPVGVSTGAWIEPDPQRRIATVARWTTPDYASVNMYEEGHAAVMHALIGQGIGIEVGLETVTDVGRLLATGLHEQVVRVLVEVIDPDPDTAAALARAIDAALDDAGITAPRLHHGEGPATWEVLRQGYAAGRQGRIGLEDVLTLPNGTVAPDNAALVRAAAGIRTPSR
jgi:uncharacterized protein (DUF849 family)